MPKSCVFRTKASSLPIAVLMVALVTLFAFYSFLNPNFIYLSFRECPSGAQSANMRRQDPPSPTFYDDPTLSYSFTRPIKNWDRKRKEWLQHHPSYAAGVSNRVLLVTGSQPSPCKNPGGDNFLLRSFKNKVDYCRIHGCEVFYNQALLQRNMTSYWAKYPIIKAAMLAHPETEWIWWVDADAIFTDMDFKLPLDRYNAHNLVVNGWPDMLFEKKSWVGLNAGVLLIRNCQWSMDFMDVWAGMGPQSPKYKYWGKVQKSIFKDKTFPESDDQTALAYLIVREGRKWGDKIYLETAYSFHGYWLGIVGTLDELLEEQLAIDKEVRILRRRHAEKVSEYYGAQRAQHARRAKSKIPFITHFTGCQPCSGEHNPSYKGDSCTEGMEKALKFGDNQVLRNFGFMHSDLLESSSVVPLPFDFPA
ncbi:Glycosyltransferase 34 [Dillenia turbinata]|uniref:Glycosyltransferase 34 n=1 Tax=Dillenia turbinata TaxID=194707 RepID=A0AAN8Z3E4_9MAGN